MRAPFAQRPVRVQTTGEVVATDSNLRLSSEKKMLGLACSSSSRQRPRCESAPRRRHPVLRSAFASPLRPRPKRPRTASRAGGYDVSKLTGDPTDIGKSTLDPVLSTSAFLSRRFGLAGGVALVALLAAVEGRRSSRRSSRRRPRRSSARR